MARGEGDDDGGSRVRAHAILEDARHEPCVHCTCRRAPGARRALTSQTPTPATTDHAPVTDRTSTLSSSKHVPSAPANASG
eukprot:899887-Rhodomonas_salina.1